MIVKLSYFGAEFEMGQATGMIKTCGSRSKHRILSQTLLQSRLILLS